MIKYPDFKIMNELIYCTILQVKEAILQKCLEVEQTAKEQAADNAILDRISKVIRLFSEFLEQCNMHTIFYV